MKKMNNKGFLMVEALIVSTFVVSVLIYFFVQFKKVDASFELSYSYNTVNGLYAVNNISAYLDSLYDSDSDFKSDVKSGAFKTSSPHYKVIYSQLDSENFTCISSQSYCGELMKSLNVKKAILASGDLDALLQFFKDVENGNSSTNEYTFFTEKMRDFIKHERSKNLYKPDYKIIVQFNDDTFASLDKIFEGSYNNPAIVSGIVSRTTNSLNIPYRLLNVDENNNYQVTCKYGISEENLASNGNVSISLENNTCTISSLNPNTIYYYSLGVTVDNETYETTPRSIRTRGFNGVVVTAGSSDTHKGIVYLDPTNLNRECNTSVYNETTNPNGYKSETETKSGCMKWYVYSNDGTDAKMILDHNTTARIEFSSTSADTSTIITEITSKLANDTAGWQIAQANIKNIEATELAAIIGKSNWKYNSDSNYFFFDTATTSKLTTFTSTSRSAYAWLYNYTYQCADASGTDYGCIKSNEDTSTSYDTYKLTNNTWNKTGTTGMSYGYLTNTAVGTTKYVWRSGYNGGVYRASAANNYYGIRPVITVPSTWLQ